MKTHIHVASRLVLIGLLCVLTGIEAGPQLHAAAGGDCKNPLIDDCRGDSDIHLMQPLDDSTKSLPVSSEPLKVFFTYFNLSWPWLLGVASGIAVLQAVWGGILVMTSFDIDGGKSKITWAVGGMVIIALVGFFLRFLNPTFYG